MTRVNLESFGRLLCDKTIDILLMNNIQNTNGKTSIFSQSKLIKLSVISFLILAVACLIVFIVSPLDYQAQGEESSEISIDESGSSAVIGDVDFGIDDFSRAQVGSNRNFDDLYKGYTYLNGDTADTFSAVYVNLDSDDPYVVCYIPSSVTEVGLDISNEQLLNNFQTLLSALDEYNANGGVTLGQDEMTWYITSEQTYTLNGIVFSFAQELKEGHFYTTIIGEDGSDVTDSSNPLYISLGHCSYGSVASSSEIDVNEGNTGWDAFVDFFVQMDYRPLFVTLQTTLVALVFIFILGLLAAYWVLTLTPKVRSIMDAIFTIPMVLPPTVCGFLLLMILGRNSPLGIWFINIGFPLIFSWPATVIAAVVVAFPLMYMNAKGAFEGLDPNMLDAARTLGWSNFKIFVRLMLPLAWSSIAAGTALSFARAAGEFGATLFLAGNYAGITQTVPLAIYFQWMNGRTDVALFWTFVMIAVSFLVILFINIWSNRTTRYRRREISES